MRKNIYARASTAAFATASAIAAVFLLLLAGCDMMTEPESGQNAAQNGKAAVSLEIAGAGGRTVAPGAGLGSVSAWKLLGGKTGNPQEPLKEFINPAGQTLYLEAGTWDFTLEGYKDPSGETLILKGTLTGKAINLEGQNTLSFTVAPVSEGTGSVKITINLLAKEHGIDRVDVYMDGEEVILDPALEPAGDSIVYEADHKAGDYFFSFRLYKDPDLYGVVSELVKVRQNLTSEKTYDLAAADLNIRYAIKYEMEGGKFNGDDSSYYDYQYTDVDFTLPEPVRGPDLFLRWYEAAPMGEVAAITAGSTGDRTFYAKWHKAGESLESAGDVGKYLEKTTGGGDAGNPVALPVDINLADGGWAALLGAIRDKGKYVDLDLAACTMGDDITEFDPNNATATGKDRIVSLVLPDTATSVRAGTGYYDNTFKNFTALKSVAGKAVITLGAYAFRGCTKLETISFPALTTIANNAFHECSALKPLDLSHTQIASIGVNAFEGCSSLKTMDLSNTQLTTIVSGAFGTEVGLETIKLPKTLTTIQPNAFSGGFLTSIDLSETSITALGSEAFQNNSRLTTVVLPEALASIGDKAFLNCGSLASIDLPEITIIGDSAFQSCGSIKSVDLPKTLESIGKNAFQDCTFTSIDLSNTKLTTISDGTFQGCKFLTTVVLPAALTSIGNVAFDQCTSLTSINLSDTKLTGIGTQVFWNCRSLTSIDLPDTFNFLGYQAFAFCSSLTKAIIRSITPPDRDSWNTFYGIDRPDWPLYYVPAGSVQIYADAWSGGGGPDIRSLDDLP